MKKQIGKNLMQKWKNKIRVRLSALDKKKLVLTNIPYALAAFYADRAFFLYRNSPGEDMGNKLLYAMEHADRIFAGFVLSNNWKDLLAGIVVAVVLKVLVWQKQADAKKLRKGIEYGSARWGNAEDIKPYMSEDPWMNIPLTATEALTMESRPKQPKYARNKNIVVIGGSGSGKTRFFVKPSVMQMNCSMVITDPKGTLIEECGKMLAKGPPKKDKNGNIMKDKSGKVVHEPYVIKVLNTINFSKSLHYNPFAYIRSEKDILKLVTTIIVNTKGEGEKASEDFWVKAEKLLYTALIAFIWYEGDEEEKNLNTLLDLLNESETREEDETYQNPVDMMFQELEERDPQHFAVRQYKKYKMAAGKTAKSILISCGARLAPFDIAELREIMSYDEMELDKIGDRKTALFLIMSDTDTTFNFVIAMLQSQLFNLLCDKADDVYGGRLPVHVRVIADEFANIGQIPQFDKLIATIRSREISASIILQSQSQLKAMYKDSADTILGNCDTTLFLGGKEKTTLKEMSELLGKETIDLYNTSETRSNQKSFGLNYQKTGKQLMTEDEIAVMDGGKCILQIRGARPFFSDKYDITKHKNYRLLADENEKNRYKVEKELNPQYTPKPEEEVEVIHVELSE
ncbi:type IV secretory system conjugative DNA transfer family protein [Faecalicatena sp. AGMB00832]|jgi:type IV secretion system protein VirD4|uniref:Type IV secretory system conjugative DNA transfer family protein n=3 Tax=Lachnospiraceae TaxID=186803 RepID=A0ABS6D9F2_9FIRM|nr:MULTISPECIES: type IV secretory system conjugative DNA transfer family protein [Lachnospiraceae]MBS6712931.1 type IV secretory system conjugative DNA transfer family protein [Ruminococcus sp.]MBY2579932.1 type IV secretory system conjugative DNA transfer family protein [Clostridioides difficile]MBT9902237.1 TraM recognition domain-containing protein [Anaerostipes hadrus]MBU3877827.1 type IV secretory system conjugative DNA transfer family protein [Faecalicatena faecalis]MCI6467986.1 type IV